MKNSKQKEKSTSNIHTMRFLDEGANGAADNTGVPTMRFKSTR